jgi:FkbM family methyltransferase
MLRIFRLLKVLRKKDFYIFPDVKIHRITLGNKNAAWTIHPDTLKKESVVYLFGVGNDISFDLAIIKQFGLTVHAFDPTPKSVLWIKAQQLPVQFIFHEIGLAAFDGQTKFYLPEDSGHISATLLDVNSQRKYFTAEVKRLSSIISLLSHDHIDLLKMDIEGSEYDVIEDIIKSKIKINQLIVEFHHRFLNVGIDKSKNTIKMLKDAGYAVFNVSSSGEEVSFIKK